MNPEPIRPVPEETARVAKAAFSKGNVYIEMRDVLGTIYEDEDFAELFATQGRLLRRRDRRVHPSCSPAGDDGRGAEPVLQPAGTPGLLGNGSGGD